jgi:hypothetical protein
MDSVTRVSAPEPMSESADPTDAADGKSRFVVSDYRAASGPRAFLLGARADAAQPDNPFEVGFGAVASAAPAKKPSHAPAAKPARPLSTQPTGLRLFAGGTQPRAAPAAPVVTSAPDVAAAASRFFADDHALASRSRRDEGADASSWAHQRRRLKLDARRKLHEHRRTARK